MREQRRTNVVTSITFFYQQRPEVQWKQLKNRSKHCLAGSEEWNDVWVQAFTIAYRHCQNNYRFLLNTSIASHKLKKDSVAFSFLEKAARQSSLHNDVPFFRAVKRQGAVMLGDMGNAEQAISTLMDIYPKKSPVRARTLGYIDTYIAVLAAPGKCQNTRITEIKEWHKSLQVVEDSKRNLRQLGYTW